MSNSKQSVIPSGSASLDVALNGGYPNGSVIEIFGQAASGKTTVALRAIAEAQKVDTNGSCCIIDVSYSYNVNHARILGVDTEKLLVVQSTCAKTLLNAAVITLHTGSARLMVIEEVNVLFTPGLEAVVAAAKKTDTTLIFTNQLNRQSETENSFMKYLASIQLKTSKMNSNKIGVQVLKNKFGSKTSELEF